MGKIKTLHTQAIPSRGLWLLDRLSPSEPLHLLLTTLTTAIRYP